MNMRTESPYKRRPRASRIVFIGVAMLACSVASPARGLAEPAAGQASEAANGRVRPRVERRLRRLKARYEKRQERRRRARRDYRVPELPSRASPRPDAPRGELRRRRRGGRR